MSHCTYYFRNWWSISLILLTFGCLLTFPPVALWAFTVAYITADSMQRSCRQYSMNSWISPWAGITQLTIWRTQGRLTSWASIDMNWLTMMCSNTKKCQLTSSWPKVGRVNTALGFPSEKELLTFLFFEKSSEYVHTQKNSDRCA